jgi:hypothetical protein
MVEKEGKGQHHDLFLLSFGRADEYGIDIWKTG